MSGGAEKDAAGGGGDDGGDDDDDFFADLMKELNESLDGDGEEAAAPAPAPQPAAASEARGQPKAAGGDLAKLTVPKLKDMLREKGLKVGGTKKELIERLSTIE